VQAYSLQATRLLMRAEVTTVVIACNTASTVALVLAGAIRAAIGEGVALADGHPCGGGRALAANRKARDMTEVVNRRNVNQLLTLSSSPDLSRVRLQDRSHLKSLVPPVEPKV
jgi:hypothetical protein